MASSTNCTACGHKISFDVKKCPSCGKNSPIPIGADIANFFGRAVGVIILFILIIVVIDSTK